MEAILSLTGPGSFVAACIVTLAAGFVKGAVGFAMPLVMVSGMTLFLPPELAIAGLILPVVISNIWQALRGGPGPALAAIRAHWRFIAIVCVMILLTAQFVVGLPDRVLYLALGVPVTGASILLLSGVRFRVSPRGRPLAEMLAGLLAGFMGGLSGIWGPPTVLYLLALETPKAQQMAVQGVVYGLCSVTLFVAHVKSGLLNDATWPFSALMLLPALAGMQLGFRMSDRLDAARFRRLTLIVLVLAGLNLLRRGLMGG